MTSTYTGNPFVVGGAISDPGGRGFYGRDDIFSFVGGALMATTRPPILLVGQRRIGKSSILRQLPRHLPSDYVCVYYDLQGRAQLTLDEVLYGLGRAVADAVGISRPTEQEATENTIDSFLARAAGALDQRPERLILLFDEFDVIDQQLAGSNIAARRFIPFLADLISRQPKIGYILVVGRRTEELSEGFFSSLLKDAVQKRIGRLERADTERLAVEAFGPTSISKEALDEIASVTAGHPFCAQVLCFSIWHMKQQRGAPATVSAADVAAAMPQALELGTLGLNWVYDGLVQSAHRLFLSALAGLAGARTTDAVSYDVIQGTLFDRRLGVDEHQLRQVPQDLRGWDVIEGSSSGFRFAVPMIGLWIRANRGLEGLEQEARLINPRASRYHELAVESFERGDFDAAIEADRQALAANPVYVEAQVGLATTFRARNRSGDLALAIEAFERALELDQNAARTPFLEALLAFIEEQTDSIADIPQYYERIRALDDTPDGLFRERAARLIERKAALRVGYGSSARLKEAMALFGLIDSKEQRERARAIHERVDKTENMLMGAWFVSGAAWLAAGLVETSLRKVPPLLPLTLACLSGLFISMNMVSEHDGRLPFRRWGYAAGLIALALGLLFTATTWRPNLWFGGVVAFMATFITNFIFNANQVPDLPAELKPSRRAPKGGSPADRLATLLESVAKSLRRKPRRAS